MSRRAGHLEDVAAAVADGELGHDDRDRALVHITWCPDCRDSVADQRRTKGRLANSQAPSPEIEIPAGLLERLTQIPGLSSDDAFALVRSPMPTPSPPRPAAERRLHRVGVRRRRLSAALAGSASVLALGVWGAPSDTSRVPYELVNAGGHPASYETVGFAHLPGSTQLRQLPGYGFLGRP
ncbi:MAG: hypothetical protein QOF57_34 [Frankiaceae bacterium]|nr:hypothetical protein [Frankiaceae bacterium]